MKDSEIIEIKHLIGKLDLKVDLLNRDVAMLEENFQVLERKLWGLGFVLLASSLAALVMIFGRYIFTGLPIVQKVSPCAYAGLMKGKENS